MTIEHELYELRDVLAQLVADGDDIQDRSQYALRLVTATLDAHEGDWIGNAWGDGTATHLGTCTMISLAFDLGLGRGTAGTSDVNWSTPLLELIERHGDELGDMDSAWPMLESDGRDPIDCHVCGRPVVSDVSSP
jgi:hypothetical protein